MADKFIAAFAQERGLPVIGDVATYRSEEGYHFSYGYLINTRTYGVSVVVDAATYTKEKFKELKSALKPHKKAPVVYDTNGLIQFGVAGMGKDSRAGHMDSTTQLVRAELARLGIAPSQTCRYCKQPGSDDSYVVDQIYHPIHNTCKMEKAASILAEVEQNQQSGSMLLGLPGAIIGAIVGALPALIMMIALNRMIMYLFVLIPMASYWGYKKIKGKLNAVVPFLVSILSLITTVFTMVVYYCYLGMKVWPNLQLSVLWARVMSAGRSDFIEDLAFALLFCLVGIVIAWSYISKSNKHRLQEAQQIINSSGPQM